MMRISRVAGLAVALIAVGYAGWHFTRAKPAPAEQAPPVPVSAAQAKQGQLPVYISNIGAVRALNSVDIRPQVGGVLIDVPVKEGDQVHKDQVLAVIDPRPLKAALDKAQAQLVQDQAQLSNAELDRQRYSSLASHDFASRQQLDTQTSTVNRLQGVISADQASIEDAQINLGYAVLKSPIDGRVGIRRVDPGNLIQANGTQPIITVVQEKPISVLFSLPESDLPRVRAAFNKGPLPALVDAPGSAQVLATGTLATIDNAVDPTSGTIQMRANFPNEDDALTSGQFVNVRLQVDTASGVVVPHTAIQHAQQGLFVFTIGDDKAVKRQDVKVSYDDGNQAVLTEGVDAGTQVVTAGQTRVGPGVKVAVNDGKESPAPAKQAAAQ